MGPSQGREPLSLGIQLLIGRFTSLERRVARIFVEEKMAKHPVLISAQTKFFGNIAH